MNRIVRMALCGGLAWSFAISAETATDQISVHLKSMEPQDVIAEGVASCGEMSIADCKAMAFSEARRAAIEQGTPVLIQSMTEMRDFTLAKDEVSSRVRGRVLSSEVLESGFMNETGYRVKIKARVQGERLPEERIAIEEAKAGALPDWVNNPSWPDSLATSACVNKKGSMNLTQRRADNAARAALGQILNTRVDVMDETTEVLDGGFSERFVAVSRSTTRVALRGSRRVASGTYSIDDEPHYCVLVALPDENVERLFEELLKDESLNDEDAGALLNVFRGEV
ncbi:MAG: hypothetical protein AAF525_03065 [Pseudomonadota bacterium]